MFTPRKRIAGTAEPPQGVYGVKPIYPFQGYIGYTFVRF